MECEDVDKIKPLDKLLDDQIREFESGRERVCDKELDKMMWELGDYENEESKMEAKEFEEDKPVEEVLIEKKAIHGTRKKPYYMKSDVDEEIPQGEEVVTGRSMTPDSGQ